MYQSIASLTSPRANSLRIFLKGRMLHPPWAEKVRNPDSWGKKIVLNAPPQGQLFSNIQQKETKHETEIMKNSTEMLICLEILKQ